MNRRLVAGVGLFLLLCTAGWVFGPRAAEGIQDVMVRNFPPVQDVAVTGSVRISGPIQQTVMTRFTGVTVPPVAPTETTRLIDAGVLETAGQPRVVLSLAGETKAAVLKAGKVGAFLVPDEEPVQQALREQGLIQFPLEVAVNVPTGNVPFFASAQPHVQTGFPRYRVLLYNTTDRTVTVNLYALLTP